MDHSEKIRDDDIERLRAVASLIETVGEAMRRFDALPAAEKQRIMRERDEFGRAIGRCILYGPTVIPKVDRHGHVID